MLSCEGVGAGSWPRAKGMRTNQQTTLKASISLSGIGVHSGNPVEITLHPAPANDGICFLRTGMPNGNDRLINFFFNDAQPWHSSVG